LVVPVEVETGKLGRTEYGSRPEGSLEPLHQRESPLLDLDRRFEHEGSDYVVVVRQPSGDVEVSEEGPVVEDVGAQSLPRLEGEVAPVLPRPGDRRAVGGVESHG